MSPWRCWRWRTPEEAAIGHATVVLPTHCCTDPIDFADHHANCDAAALPRLVHDRTTITPPLVPVVVADPCLQPYHACRRYVVPVTAPGRCWTGLPPRHHDKCRDGPPPAC